MAVAKVDALFRVALESAINADKAGASVWDALAVWASTEERAGLAGEGLKNAIKSQVDAYLEESKVEFDQNKLSTWRVYRKLIVDARTHSVPVTLVDEGAHMARSVGDVRKDVKAAKQAAEPEGDGGDAEATGRGGEFADFDSLPDDKKVAALVSVMDATLARMGGPERAAALVLVDAMLAKHR